MNEDSKQLLQLLTAPFSSDQIKHRDGPKKNGVAVSFAYIPTDTLKNRLDEVLGLMWNWNLVSSSLIKVSKTKDKWENGKKVGSDTVIVEQVIVHGKLTIFVGDKEIVRESFGGCEMGYGTSAGDPYKIADSSAFRKACDTLGMARGLVQPANNTTNNFNSNYNKPNNFGGNTTQPQSNQSSNPFIKS